MHNLPFALPVFLFYHQIDQKPGYGSTLSISQYKNILSKVSLPVTEVKKKKKELDGESHTLKKEIWKQGITLI